MGGGQVPMLNVKKPDKAQRKSDRMFMEMGISRAAQVEIYQCLIAKKRSRGIRTSEVLTALESEPDWSNKPDYSYRSKRSLIKKVILAFDMEIFYLLLFYQARASHRDKQNKRTAQLIPTPEP